MRRRLIPLLCLAVALAAALPASADAARFGAYVSCSLRTDAVDSRCSLGATPAAVFRAFARAGVRYKVCVRKPGGNANCRVRRTGRRGVRSRAAIALTQPGRYAVSWFVGPSRVDRDRFRARAPRVFANGDSLGVGTRPYLDDALRGWPVSQSASISRHEGVELLRSKSNLARIVVMSLGTNDDPRATDDFGAAIKASVRLVGARGCVVWPNIVRPPVAGKSYAEYNSILARLNRHFDNLLVVDWVSMVRNRSWSMAPDGVHPDAEGYRARARAIAAKVRRCID